MALDDDGGRNCVGGRQVNELFAMQARGLCVLRIGEIGNGLIMTSQAGRCFVYTVPTYCERRRYAVNTRTHAHIARAQFLANAQSEVHIATVATPNKLYTPH